LLVGKLTRKYFLGFIGKEIEENVVDFSTSLAAYFPNLNSETLQPFMTKTGVPNVLSIFHLAFQGLEQDFVCPSFHVANWQPALQPDMMEKARHLPSGFLGEFTSVDDDMSNLIVE
jgi:hypothetical protein